MRDTPADRIAAAIFAEPLHQQSDGTCAPMDAEFVAGIWRSAIEIPLVCEPTQVAA